jgi:acyl-coenzyme A synthetase/AMP-(fatty) acid ligase
VEQGHTPGRALVAPFLAAATREPRLPWARARHGERTLGASRRSILAAAEELRARGFPPGTLVGLVLGAAPASIEALAALWWAELVPLLIDPGVPRGAELEISGEMGARLAWRPAEGWNERLDASTAAGLGAAKETAPRLAPGAAAVRLTSGSSGAPHGVQVSAAGLRADTDALVACMGLRPSDRALVAVPLSHSYGFSVLAVPALTHGLPLVFPGPEGVLDAARALDATFLPSVPAWYRSILRSADSCLAPSLRLLVSAGAPLAPEVAREFRARFGLAIHVLYGASECGSITYDRTGTAAERGCVGTPLDGVTIELRERESEDAPGAVSVRSPALGLGYLPEREGDRARLDGRAFHGDDLARWRDGELELAGRRSDWINVKGRKVDPHAVEAAIAAHPAVREVVVLGKTRAGQDSDEIVRAVIVRGGELEFLDVIEWCRPRLAPYQLPRSVLFVGELPRTERGKLDRAKLMGL